ncbi:hypothetical protein VaNZ11_009568 [Volvox africanus]|uniref:Retrotransposon gag domain-containing protein n=1 Tax=Volvox africanus TaxID=51714 RepID=A0ABQ5S903_9CHLO|nr:hypothetical protein VaNZ11_009568 [Volvox africanus]
MLLWQVVSTFRTSLHLFPVSNHLTPGAVDIPGMAPAAAATTCAAVAGTSSRPPRPPHTGHEDEVIKIAIAVPKLNIPMDVKLSDLGRVAAPLTRAFVRNVRNYFVTARGGQQDSTRRLFLATAFEGAARLWHDQWTNARDSYTSEELLEALLVRFAPQVQSRDTEARLKLNAGKYRMRPGETVSAYQSRFEALVTPIADLSDSERVFWFQQGLSSDLSGDCATDLSGKTFKSYTDLVQFSLGAELRLLAGRESDKLAVPK